MLSCKFFYSINFIECLVTRMFHLLNITATKFDIQLLESAYMC